MSRLKTALITGSTRGIGKEIAISYAKKGFNVILNGRNNEQLKVTFQEIKEINPNADYHASDVSKIEGAASLIEFAEDKFGSIDVLVNNAGITKDSLLPRMTEENWDEVIRVNLKSVFNCTKLACRPMIKQRSGCIINISSIIGLIGNAGQANYATSKAGIIGFTKSIAKEFAPKNITCNAIAPGFITTDMTKNLPETVLDECLKRIPLKRFGTPTDVANAAVFLFENPYITGQVLVIDGGLDMW